MSENQPQLPYPVVTNGQDDDLKRDPSMARAILWVGTVQRRDVDSRYTCLASNSNMTQASREEVQLQLNRECYFVYGKLEK